MIRDIDGSGRPFAAVDASVALSPSDRVPFRATRGSEYPACLHPANETFKEALWSAYPSTIAAPNSQVTSRIAPSIDFCKERHSAKQLVLPD